jgi:membrane fusion protein, heavy metal efflux system
MNHIKNIITGLLVLSAAACKQNQIQDPPAQKFCLTPMMEKKIQVSTVKMDTVKNEISLSGQIAADEDKWVKVFPVVGGVVKELKVQLGDYVKKGQELAVIQSTEIADYEGQLSSAESNVNIAEKTLTSNEEMFKSGLATERDVVSSKNELQKAKAELTRLRQTLGIYGAHANAVQTLYAPVSGFVVEKNVTDNMQFRPDGAQPFFTISNLDEVWVMASVFESDIAKIKVGYEADVKVLAYKDKIFKAKVDRIFSQLDPQSRVMKVRIRIPNKDFLLKPEMFAEIRIVYDDGSKQMPAVPAQSIIFDKNKNFVMVYKDSCNIETREVEVFQTIGDTAYIKSGLDAGEKVISQYQLLVYDALND